MIEKITAGNTFRLNQVEEVDKQKDVIQERRHLSRDKLVAYIVSMRVDTSPYDADIKYMFGLGKNMLGDALIAGIYCGDFDETKE